MRDAKEFVRKVKSWRETVAPSGSLPKREGALLARYTPRNMRTMRNQQAPMNLKADRAATLYSTADM